MYVCTQKHTCICWTDRHFGSGNYLVVREVPSSDFHLSLFLQSEVNHFVSIWSSHILLVMYFYMKVTPATSVSPRFLKTTITK